MINYNKNELIRVWLEEYYATFQETCGTADYVPKKYNAVILRYIFKNMKRQSRKLNREDRKYQRRFKKRQRRKRREKRKRERERRRVVQQQEKDKRQNEKLREKRKRERMRRKAAQRQGKDEQREKLTCQRSTARKGDTERRNAVEPREVNQSVCGLSPQTDNSAVD